MLAETQNINKGIKDVNAQLGTFGKTAGKVGGLMKGAFVAAGAAIAGAKIGGFLKDSVTAASDLNETISKTQTIFGNAAPDILKFGDGAAKSLGLSKAAALEGVSTFGNFFNQIGIGTKQSAKLSKGFVQMSSDLASFNNADPAEVMDSLAAATRGEYDSLQKYIPTVNAAKVQQEALRATGKKSVDQLTDADKALALNTLAYKGMGKAQGDFKRTSGGLANQQRILSAQFADLKTKIGQALLPVVTKTITFLNSTALPAFESLGKKIGPVTDAIKGFFSGTGGGTSALTPVVTFIKTQVLPAITGIGNAYMNLYNTLLPIVGAIVSGIMAKWSVIKPQLQSIWTSVKTIITSALSIIQTYVRFATAVLSKAWQLFGANIVRYVSNALTGVIQILSGAFKIIAGVFKVISSVLRGDWKGAWNGIKQILSGALGVIKGLIKVSFATVRLIIGAAWTAVKALTSAAWSGIKSVVRSAVGALIGIVTAIPSKILSALGNLGSLLYNAGSQIIQGLIDGIEDKISVVTSKLKSLTDLIPKVKGPPKRDRRLLTPAGRAIMQSLVDGFVKGEAGVKSALEGVTKTIQKIMNKRYKNDKVASAATKAVIKSLRNEAAAVLKVAKARDAVNAKLETAKKGLADLKQQAADYAASIKQTIVDSGNITNLNSAFTPEAMIQQLSAQVEKAKKFAAVIKDLQAKGLNQTNIDQLLQAGPDSLASALALQAGGKEGIKQINTLQSELAKTGQSLGDSASKALYGANIKAANTYVNSLTAQSNKLYALERKKAQAYATELSRLTAKTPAKQTVINNKVSVQVNGDVDPVASGRKIAKYLDAYYAQGGRRK